MPEVLERLADVPLGGHCLGLYTDAHESADQAASFLEGTPKWQAAAYWVADPEAYRLAESRVAQRAPDHVGCIGILPGFQVEHVEGRLRPASIPRAFLAAHPDGVSAGADTLSRSLDATNIPDHLEYEAWLDGQPRDTCRFLCPYDLRMIPPQFAPRILRDLGLHHSHVALSESRSPAVELLELFVFPSYQELPAAQMGVAEEAIGSGLLLLDRPSGLVELTERGAHLVLGWSQSASAAVRGPRPGSFAGTA